MAISRKFRPDWNGSPGRVFAKAAVGLAVAIAAQMHSHAARAQPSNLETAVKANFLYKFAPFVAWPPQALGPSGAPFTLCVFGEDPFGRQLDDVVRGQTVDGRRVQVRRLAHIDRGAECRVLFVGRSRSQAPADVLAMMRGAPVLTVTDEHDGVDGGIIHFVLQDGRVRFSIDDGEARAAGLSLSGKLLALATSVRGAGG